jgi:hypothetical protein
MVAEKAVFCCVLVHRLEHPRVDQPALLEQEETEKQEPLFLWEIILEELEVLEEVLDLAQEVTEEMLGFTGLAAEGEEHLLACIQDKADLGRKASLLFTHTFSYE